jgi:hypothetical protein
MKGILLYAFGFILFVKNIPVFAQEQLFPVITGVVALVNQNIWRGCYVAGASLQPEAVVGIRNWQFSVWGSSGFRTGKLKEDREIDLTVKYLWQDLGIGITDYWVDKQDAPYGKNHLLEANFEYRFRKISVNVNYNVLVAGENNRFSPYIEAGYTPEWKACILEFALGFTPWENTALATTGLAATRLSVGVSKTLAAGCPVPIEAFANLTCNPNANAFFGTAGLRICLNFSKI